MDRRLMRFGFGPGSGELYALLARAGENAVETAEAVERRFREFPAPSVSQDDVKAFEHAGDAIVSELLRCINAQFVTPYDREDLVTLAFAVDEVPDKIENASELLGLYGVEAPTRQSLELCALLVRATKELAALLARLRGLRGSAEEIRTIKAIEDEADTVARAARASLFKDDRIDPVIVIRWKGIYEALEEAVDACETAAHRIGNILVKSA
jgi:predicted phosphate transport protein (TIGR00153 family)